MKKRLRVLLDDSELREVRALARREGLTVAEWVRRALRAARRGESQFDPSRKLEATRRAARHNFPTADINQMLGEIERSYTLDAPRSSS